jgi:hypothetical protein
VRPEDYDGDPFRFLDQLQVETRGAGLVVIDALYLLSPTTQNAGNDAARMTPIMRRLDQLSTVTGAAVILVAHDNKAGGDVAGSFAIRAMAKSILRLTLPRGDEQADGDDPPATARRVLRVESKLTRAGALVLEIGGVGRWTLLGSPATVRVKDTRSAILDYLAGQSEPAPEKEIHAAITGRREAKVAALRELLGEGLVQRTGAGAKGDPYLYTTPPDPTKSPHEGSLQDSGSLSSSLGSGTRNQNDSTQRFTSEDSGTEAPGAERAREPESATPGRASKATYDL